MNLALKDRALDNAWDLCVAAKRSVFIHLLIYSLNLNSFYWFSCCFLLLFIFYWAFFPLKLRPKRSTNQLASFLLGADVRMLIHPLHPNARFFPDFCRFDGNHPQRFLLLCLKQAERCPVFVRQEKSLDGPIKKVTLSHSSCHADSVQPLVSTSGGCQITNLQWGLAEVYKRKGLCFFHTISIHCHWSPSQQPLGQSVWNAGFEKDTSSNVTFSASLPTMHWPESDMFRRCTRSSSAAEAGSRCISTLSTLGVGTVSIFSRSISTPNLTSLILLLHYNLPLRLILRIWPDIYSAEWKIWIYTQLSEKYILHALHPFTSLLFLSIVVLYLFCRCSGFPGRGV